jgi:hypothetical protein
MNHRAAFATRLVVIDENPMGAHVVSTPEKELYLLFLVHIFWKAVRIVANRPE